MKKTCVGCAKKIPAAARNCFFCGERQPEGGGSDGGGEKATTKQQAAGSGNRKSASVAVVGPDGAPKRVSASHPSQTLDTLLRLDDTTKEALRDVVKRTQTPAAVSAVAAPAAAAVAVEKPGEKPAEKPAEKPVEKPAEAMVATSAAASALGPETEVAPATSPPVTETAAPARTKTNVTRMMSAIVLPVEAPVEPTTKAETTPSSDPAETAGPEIGTDVTPVKVAAVKPATLGIPVEAPAPVAVARPEAEREDEAEAPVEARPAPAEQWALLGRVVMGLGGVMMLALFALSSQILVVFTGSALALHLFFLMGGVLLVGAATVPLPARVRGGLGAVLGAVAVFLAAPSLEGFDGWRGVLAALAFTALPGGLLLRTRHNGRTLPRLAVLAGVALVAVAYLVPDEDGTPLTAALALLSRGPIVGVLALLPMLLALLALSVSTRGAAKMGPIWAAALLVAVPAAVSAAGMATDDRALVHLGVTLLAAGGAAAMGLAEVFAPDESSLQAA